MVLSSENNNEKNLAGAEEVSDGKLLGKDRAKGAGEKLAEFFVPEEALSFDSVVNNVEIVPGRSFENYKPVEFREVEDESEEEFKERSGLRMDRKFRVALLTGSPEAFLEEDFDLNSPEARKDIKEGFDKIKEEGGERFIQRSRNLIGAIETPYEHFGPEKMYSELKDNANALRLIFSRVPEAWENMDEAKGNPDAEGQKKISLVAINAFMKKYPNVMDAFEAESKFRGEISEANPEEVKAYEGDVEEMNEILYGPQNGYAKIAQEIGQALEKKENEEQKKNDVIENEAEVSSEESDADRQEGEEKTEEEVKKEVITEEKSKGFIPVGTYDFARAGRRLGHFRMGSVSFGSSERKDSEDELIEKTGSSLPSNEETVKVEETTEILEGDKKEEVNARGEIVLSDASEEELEKLISEGKIVVDGSDWVSQVDGRTYRFSVELLLKKLPTFRVERSGAKGPGNKFYFTKAYSLGGKRIAVSVLRPVDEEK